MVVHIQDGSGVRVSPRGSYVPSEVASYLQAASPIEHWAPSSRRLISWVRRGLLASACQQVPGRDIIIDFDDLVSSQAITLLREAGFPLQTINRAEAYFRDVYGITRPFAHHRFWTSGPDIFGRLGDLLIAGTRGGQIAMAFMVDWLRPVEARFGFDDQQGTALWWRPDERIELNPRVQFGAPCLADTSIPSAALWSYVRAGDPVVFVARSYGLGVTDVERAVAWEDRRRGALARIIHGA